MASDRLRFVVLEMIRRCPLGKRRWLKLELVARGPRMS